jgi:hypothetical protein
MVDLLDGCGRADDAAVWHSLPVLCVVCSVQSHRSVRMEGYVARRVASLVGYYYLYLAAFEWDG